MRSNTVNGVTGFHLNLPVIAGMVPVSAPPGRVVHTRTDVCTLWIVTWLAADRSQENADDEHVAGTAGTSPVTRSGAEARSD